jgi:ribosomal protein S19
MTRSKWKGNIYYYKKNFVNKFLGATPILKYIDFKSLYTSKRECVFTPQLIGKKVHIHNGKDWYKVFVIFDILFHQFGKFVWTKKRCIYKKNKKKKKSK